MSNPGEPSSHILWSNGACSADWEVHLRLTSFSFCFFYFPFLLSSLLPLSERWAQWKPSFHHPIYWDLAIVVHFFDLFRRISKNEGAWMWACMHPTPWQLPFDGLWEAVQQKNRKWAKEERKMKGPLARPQQYDFRHVQSVLRAMQLQLWKSRLLPTFGFFLTGLGHIILIALN